MAGGAGFRDARTGIDRFGDLDHLQGSFGLRLSDSAQRPPGRGTESGSHRVADRGIQENPAIRLDDHVPANGDDRILKIGLDLGGVDRSKTGPQQSAKGQGRDIPQIIAHRIRRHGKAECRTARLPEVHVTAGDPQIGGRVEPGPVGRGDRQTARRHIHRSVFDKCAKSPPHHVDRHQTADGERSEGRTTDIDKIGNPNLGNQTSRLARVYGDRSVPGDINVRTGNRRYHAPVQIVDSQPGRNPAREESLRSLRRQVRAVLGGQSDISREIETSGPHGDPGIAADIVDRGTSPRDELGIGDGLQNQRCSLKVRLPGVDCGGFVVVDHRADEGAGLHRTAGFRRDGNRSDGFKGGIVGK